MALMHGMPMAPMPRDPPGRKQWYPDLPKGGCTKGLSCPYLIDHPECANGSLIHRGFCGGVMLPATVDLAGSRYRGLLQGGFGENDPFDDVGGKGGFGNLFGAGGTGKVVDGDGGDGGNGDADKDPFEGVDWQGKTDGTPPVYRDHVNFFKCEGAKRDIKRDASRLVQRYDLVHNRPVSQIGPLNRLPGEVRNRIYRFALLNLNNGSGGMISVGMKPNTCAHGKCLHMKAATALPGILTTCRQIREEAGPVFFWESKGFVFEDQVVLQGCVPNWIRCIGGFVKHIKVLDFKMKRQEVIPPGLDGHRAGDFAMWIDFHMRVLMPPMEHVADDFEFESICKTDDAAGDYTCVCPLGGRLINMNRMKQNDIFAAEMAGQIDLFEGPLPDLMPVGKYILSMVESEQFSDTVFRLRTAGLFDGRRCINCMGKYWYSL